MSDQPTTVEKLGIEHVPDEMRHGTPNRTFTLWFAANLTIADFVIGVITTVYLGFTLSQALPILAIGNIVGGLLVGFAAGMGPSLGYPQMLSSRASFGRVGNYIPGALNWVSTVGWFTVNTILAVFALQAVFPSANFYLAAAGYVLIQALIALYGHDFIHLFEKAMSVVLGLLFLAIFALTVPRWGDVMSYVPAGGAAQITLGSFGLLLVIAFSYLMSWSPYASDYSRYLKPTTSRSRVIILTTAGGAISSFVIEVVGAAVGTLSASDTAASANPFGGLYLFAGSLGGLAMLTLILGAFAADALNLYTNSLSALVLDVKVSRRTTVIAGAVVGLAIASYVGEGFEKFYEDFLLALAYWIMPWLAIVLVDFYLVGRTTVERLANPLRWDLPVLGLYFLSILASVPFMNLTGIGYQFEGPLSSSLGGADLSYFVSFFVAFLLTYLLRRAIRTK